MLLNVSASHNKNLVTNFQISKTVRCMPRKNDIEFSKDKMQMTSNKLQR